MTRAINIERLVLKLPQGSRPGRSRAAAEAYARVVAGQLAESLHDSVSPSVQSLGDIRVSLANGQANAESVSRAVRTAIGRRATAATGKGG